MDLAQGLLLYRSEGACGHCTVPRNLPLDMKLLTIGDLHYNMRQFDWVVANASNYDMIIIAGDLLNIAGHLDLDTQILVVNKYLQRLKAATTVLVCSGNHDGDRKGEGGEFFADWLDTDGLDGIHGDGASLRRGGWLFSICPWWDGPVGQARAAGRA